MDTCGVVMEYKYIYRFERDRMEKFWNYKINKINLNKPNLYENVILIPATRKDRSLLFGEGGVLDQNFLPIEESFIKKNKNNELSFGIITDLKKKEINVKKELDGEYVYLGYINNHWGHFIVDFCTRLYYAKKNPDKNFIFLINSKEKKINLIPQIKRFIELLGVDIKKITFVNKITKVQKLIIPMPSYQHELYYSDEYLEIFDTVTDNIHPTYNNKFDKVYFSRTKINKSINREIGIENLDDIFRENKYHIIYPENETLDNQIFILNNCREICAVIGSIFHNIMYIKNNNIKIFCINKTYLNNTFIRDTCKIRGKEPVFIDAYISKAPVLYGYGPFLIEINENLKKFFYDQKIKLNENKYNKKIDTINKISKYSLMYYIFYYYKKRKICFDANPNANNYFSVLHYELYIKKYAKFEIFPLNLFTITYSIHVLIELLKKKIRELKIVVGKDLR